ncbi:hypothetical protein [Corynebacterium pseudopelargi]|uniref:Uncharacterized protein n=1 Tax=Corynebacterium pseudopelargi TaxID=2080757 RepID=A0A3G6IZ56_9CORY|nr:hypothetical protein [Corynebacterium pseudopelargi]AZA09330.1 hypothetical protein CPPEL_06060 [Corynebacterium pseudopelargi]
MTTTNLKSKTVTANNGAVIHLHTNNRRDPLDAMQQAEDYGHKHNAFPEPAGLVGFATPQQLERVKGALANLPTQPMHNDLIISDVPGTLFANVEDGQLFVMADADLPLTDTAYLVVWKFVADHSLVPFKLKVWEDSTTACGESLSWWFAPASDQPEPPVDGANS